MDVLVTVKAHILLFHSLRVGQQRSAHRDLFRLHFSTDPRPATREPQSLDWMPQRTYEALPSVGVLLEGLSGGRARPGRN